MPIRRTVTSCPFWVAWKVSPSTMRVTTARSPGGAVKVGAAVGPGPDGPAVPVAISTGGLPGRPGWVAGMVAPSGEPVPGSDVPRLTRLVAVGPDGAPV